MGGRGVFGCWVSSLPHYSRNNRNRCTASARTTSASQPEKVGAGRECRPQCQRPRCATRWEAQHAAHAAGSRLHKTTMLLQAPHPPLPNPLTPTHCDTLPTHLRQEGRGELLRLLGREGPGAQGLGGGHVAAQQAQLEQALHPGGADLRGGRGASARVCGGWGHFVDWDARRAASTGPD